MIINYAYITCVIQISMFSASITFITYSLFKLNKKINYLQLMIFDINQKINYKEKLLLPEF